MNKKEVNTVNYDPSSFEINLKDLFLFLLNRWYFILVSSVIGAVIMGFITDTEVIPMYKSESMLFVARAGSIQSFSDLQLGTYMTGDYIVISKSKPVLDTAIQSIYEKDGIQLSRSQVASAVDVSTMDDTHILKFTVTMDDPEIACDLCNAVMDAMADQIAYIANSDKPTIVERAEVNGFQINAGENNNRQVAIGGFGGAVVVIAILAIIFVFDDKIKTAEDIEKYVGATVIAIIPLDKAQTFKKTKKKKHSS